METTITTFITTFCYDGKRLITTFTTFTTLYKPVIDIIGL